MTVVPDMLNTVHMAAMDQRVSVSWFILATVTVSVVRTDKNCTFFLTTSHDARSLVTHGTVLIMY